MALIASDSGLAARRVPAGNVVAFGRFRKLAKLQARRGGRSCPTRAYEAVLYAAMQGDSTPLTRQGSVEETWWTMAPPLETPPPVHAYALASWGSGHREQLRADAGGWHDPAVVGVTEMTSNSTRARAVEGAAAELRDRDMRHTIREVAKPCHDSPWRDHHRRWRRDAGSSSGTVGRADSRRVCWGRGCGR